MAVLKFITIEPLVGLTPELLLAGVELVTITGSVVKTVVQGANTLFCEISCADEETMMV